jgi:hypothetical protein
MGTCEEAFEGMWREHSFYPRIINAILEVVKELENEALAGHAEKRSRQQ